MDDKITIKARCGDCGGTGLYKPYEYPADTRVVCLNCNGSGCVEHSYVPFAGRLDPPPEVTTVVFKQDRFETDGLLCTVKEFLDGSYRTKGDEEL